MHPGKVNLHQNSPLISGLSLKLLHCQALGSPLQRVPRNLTAPRQSVLISYLVSSTLEEVKEIFPRQTLQVSQTQALTPLLLVVCWQVSQASCPLGASSSPSPQILSAVYYMLIHFCTVSRFNLSHILLLSSFGARNWKILFIFQNVSGWHLLCPVALWL